MSSTLLAPSPKLARMLASFRRHYAEAILQMALAAAAKYTRTRGGKHITVADWEAAGDELDDDTLFAQRQARYIIQGQFDGDDNLEPTEAELARLTKAETHWDRPDVQTLLRQRDHPNEPQPDEPQQE